VKDAANMVRVVILNWREKAWLFHAGLTGIAWPVCANRLTRRILAAVTSKGGARPSRKGPTESARKGLIVTEMGEVNQRKREVEVELKASKQRPARKEEATPERSSIPARASATTWWLLGLAMALLAGDALFIFIALADHFGVDITGNIGDASPVLLSGIGAATLVVVLVNAWCGSKATITEPPVTRLWGRIGLAVLAVAVAGLRVGASPDDSIWFVVVGFMMTLAGGLAAGGAHHRLAAELHARAEVRGAALAIAQRHDEAKAGVTKLEGELRNLEDRRRSLTAELDDLAGEHEQRATEDQELDRLKEARLAEGRYFYNLGANFAGRKPAAEEGKDNA
jgi:hypothetical protein